MSEQASVFVGDTVKWTALFTDENGDPADPTDVIFVKVEPDGTVTEFDDGGAQVTNPDVGTWVFTEEVSQKGRNVCYVVGSGALNKSDRSVLHVDSGPPAETP